MSHEKLVALIREQDRLVLRARNKRDEARQKLDIFMVSSEKSIETSEEYIEWINAKDQWYFALISFNREIANA